MPIEKLVVSLEVPKESKELADALSAVVLHVRHGKGLAEAGELLKPVLDAVDGIDQLDDEAKSQHLDEAVGYLAHKIIGALREPVAVPAVAE